MLVLVLGSMATSCRERPPSSYAQTRPAPTVGWPSYGGDPGGARFSTAAQIDRSNVSGLRPAWVYRTGDLAAKPEAMKRSAFEATPILVGDELVMCTPFNDIIALDPQTGRQRWRHDAGVSTTLIPGNGFHCRGVAQWTDPRVRPDAPCATRILVGTVDARLLAVDARTGAACASFGIGGVVKLNPGRPLEWPGEYGVDSAPTVVDDLVVVGSAVSDGRRVAAPLGAVHAFDARTGALRWSFDPIPRAAAAPASRSWPRSPPSEGAANVWSTMSVDPGRDLIFLPTSSPSPDYFGGSRAGDDRDSDSVVALKAKTGEVAWAYQVVHHDLWDYDVPGQPGLYTIVKDDGRRRDVVVTATKSGFLFVLDRDTGRPVFPVREAPAPQGGAPGEHLSPTQPTPVVTPPLAPDHLAPDQAFGLTPWDRGACRRKIAALRNDGRFTPPSLQGSLEYPFYGGGAEWGSTAFDPALNLVFVNVNSLAGAVRLTLRRHRAALQASLPKGEEIAEQAGTPYLMTREVLLSPWGLPCSPPPWGTLQAIDMATGKRAWTTPLGTTHDIAPFGIALRYGVPNLGGPIATSGGLVFIGAAVDDYLRAFDTASGRELWKGRLPAGGQATPMTYVWRGRQYVVIAAGGHATSHTRLGDSVVAFALP